MRRRAFGLRAALIVGTVAGALLICPACFFSLDEALWRARADGRGEQTSGDGPAASETAARDQALPDAGGEGRPPDLGGDGCAATCGDGQACVGGQCQTACSAGGVATGCDPGDGSGCAAGRCYLTADGPACVCPPGDVAEGGECRTTARCAPGMVCAGSSAPGNCRRVCDPQPAAQPACDGGWQCIFITLYPDYGYCRPPA